MRNNRRPFRALLVALALCSCATNKAPRGWLDEPAQLQTSAYGAWIQASCVRDPPSEPVSVSGELIAVDPDSVYIARDRMVAVPRVSIKRAQLIAYDADVAGMVALTIVGTISTLSHGWGLGLSAPVWIIGGSIATAGRSREPIRTYPQYSLESFAPYARFPYGLPKAIDRKGIRIKGSY